MDPPSNICVLCGKDDESPKNVVGSKGMKSIRKTCKQKGETDLHKNIEQLVASESKIVVHINCRKRFTDPRTIEPPVVKKLRSSVDYVFNWKEDCFLCEKSCDKRRGKFKETKTLSLRNAVLERACEREDEWGKKILARMEGCADLVAVEAVYHANCMAEIRLNEEPRRPTAGRPADKKNDRGI